MREVVLKVTSQKDLIKHQSAASTFGELKKEMKQVKWSGMRVVERSTKTTLQMDDAVLPQGDFVLFLVPEKVKSGRKTEGGASELSGPIEDCKYNELRSHISWLNREKGAGLVMSGGTADLQKVLKKYYKDTPAGKSSGKPKASKAAPKANAADAVKAVEEAKKYKPTKRQDDEDDEDYADRIAYEEKAFNKKEAKRIAKLEEERKAKEAAEKKAAEKKPKKKGLFSRKREEEEVDPIEKIETARNNINQAVDEIVQGHLSGAAPIVPGGPLEYTLKGLEKELEQVHKALRTSRSNAKYID